MLAQSSTSTSTLESATHREQLQGHALLATTVAHHRYQPKRHALRYRHTYYWLSLNQLSDFAHHSWLASVDRWNVLSIYPKDYLPNETATTATESAALEADARLTPQQTRADSAAALIERVQRLLKHQFDVDLPNCHVQLLTLPRHFGKAFNPVSFFFVYASAQASAPSYFIAEITNTPWGERFAYAFAWQPDQTEQTFEFDKAFHVSPFFPMDLRYIWTVSLRKQQSHIRMQLWQEQTRYFDAFMQWKYTFLTQAKDQQDDQQRNAASLTRAILKAPLQTLRVIGAIYWQAFKLYCKRVPFYPHPDKASKANH